MTNEKRSRGRPKDRTKEISILNAARTLFLTRGPDVTLDEIAATAGVAKVTLYAKFSDKNSLIKAVIRRESDLTVTDEQLVKFSGLKIQEALFEFGIQFLTFINSRDLLGWDRLISSLEEDENELPREFFDLGPGRGQRLLTHMIATAADQGQLVELDPVDAADVLTGLWLGFVHLEIKLGVKSPLLADEINKRVKNGVEIFMKVYQAA